MRMHCTACAPPCSNATSTSRLSPCCWPKSTASARSSAAMPDALHATQFAFAAHLRDPARHPAPDDIEDRRMAIYRDLVFNGLEALLASNFPVIRGTLG